MTTANVGNMILETSAAPGTATGVNLAGAVDGRRAFSSTFSNGDTLFYFMDDGSQLEWGLGAYTSGSPNQLSRTTVLGNSAGTTSRLNFSGLVYVYTEIPAEYSLYINVTGGFTPATLSVITLVSSGAISLTAAGTWTLSGATGVTISSSTGNVSIGATLGDTAISAHGDVTLTPGTGSVVVHFAKLAGLMKWMDETATTTFGQFSSTGFLHETATNDPIGATTDGVAIRPAATASGNGLQAIYRANGTGLDIGLGTTATKAINFFSAGAHVGDITLSGAGTAYNTTSDYRIKENVEPLTGALGRLARLHPVRFNFAGHEPRVDGFLAHEVAEVVPEAVAGSRDAVDDKGNPILQRLDASKLMPLVLAAVQELAAIVADQKRTIDRLSAAQ